MSFGVNAYNSPALGLGGLMAFMSGMNMASFIGSSTWVARPTSASVGDILNVTDVGPTPGSLFVWNGSRWVTNFEQTLTTTYVAAAAHTGTLTKTAIISTTVPGNLLGPNGYIVVEFASSVTNSGNIKLWNLTLGATDLFHFGPTTSSYIGGRCQITNRNSNSSQLGTPLGLTSPTGSGVNSLMTASVDTTADVTLTLNATLLNIGDSMTFQGWRVSFLSKA